MPYAKGLMLSLPSSAAADACTRSPCLISCTLDRISIVPFWIFVEMPSAWKKDVWEGSSDVGPDSMRTSACATAPAFATDGRRNSSSLSLMKLKSSWTKRMPTLPMRLSATQAQLSSLLFSQ